MTQFETELLAALREIRDALRKLDPHYVSIHQIDLTNIRPLRRITSFPIDTDDAGRRDAGSLPACEEDPPISAYEDDPR